MCLICNKLKMILEHGRLCCSHSALLSTEGSVTFIILHYCQQRALLHSLFCTIVNRGLCYIHYFALLSTEGSVTFIILHFCQQRALLHSLFCTIVNRGLCYIHYFQFFSRLLLSLLIFSVIVVHKIPMCSYYEIINAQFV